MIGTTKLYHISTFNTPVEIAKPTVPLGPAWAPPQEAVPPGQPQVQQGGSGFAVVTHIDSGFAVR
jgi:hypothetical protein